MNTTMMSNLSRSTTKLAQFLIILSNSRFLLLLNKFFQLWKTKIWPQNHKCLTKMKKKKKKMKESKPFYLIYQTITKSCKKSNKKLKNTIISKKNYTKRSIANKCISGNSKLHLSSKEISIRKWLQGKIKKSMKLMKSWENWGMSLAWGISE